MHDPSFDNVIKKLPEIREKELTALTDALQKEYSLEGPEALVLTGLLLQVQNAYPGIKGAIKYIDILRKLPVSYLRDIEVEILKVLKLFPQKD